MSKLYSVACNAPTPLAKNPYECMADDEADAVAKFKARNGIADTDHPITAIVVNDVPADDKKPKKTKANKEQVTPQAPPAVPSTPVVPETPAEQTSELQPSQTATTPAE
jgi:hypothetical protein